MPELRPGDVVKLVGLNTAVRASDNELVVITKSEAKSLGRSESLGRSKYGEGGKFFATWIINPPGSYHDCVILRNDSTVERLYKSYRYRLRRNFDGSFIGIKVLDEA